MKMIRVKNLAGFFCALLLTGFSVPVWAHADEASKFPSNVRVEQNVGYLGGDRSEKSDLYLPQEIPKGRRLPAVVIIHGGGWNDGVRNGKREINIGTTLAQNGYIGMSIDYLLSHGKYAVWPTNLYDCKNAVRWLRKNADRLQIDPDHIGVIGGSAGGHLAAMVALTGPGDGLEPSGPYPGISDRVDCCVDMYGIADLTTYEPHASMLGKTLAAAPDLYRAASPVSYIRSNSSPILILHGTADKTVSPNQSKLFAAALAKAGVPHDLVWIEGAPHSFTLEPPQRDLRPLVLDFFNRYLKPSAAATRLHDTAN
jgi:acetyl esterase/lipase